MNQKTVVQTFLLLLLGASVVTWAWRTWAGTGAAVPAAMLADGVVVFNFHGTRR